MGEIKPNFNPENIGETHRDKGGNFFDPMTYDGITPRCCCGYELVKEDEDVFRCTGGSHRYRMSRGEIVLDKFGQPMLKKPEGFGGNIQ